ncbi:hypothetical protein RJ641_013705 [Dillenia turbinata]|uniref:Uncharacterized protein n=1 Tax=Dillenia turbinata TaxID=194707 RepID=A0AAN8WCK8_9MAGN
MPGHSASSCALASSITSNAVPGPSIKLEASHPRMKQSWKCNLSHAGAIKGRVAKCFLTVDRMMDSALGHDLE